MCTPRARDADCRIAGRKASWCVAQRCCALAPLRIPAWAQDSLAACAALCCVLYNAVLPCVLRCWMTALRPVVTVPGLCAVSTRLFVPGLFMPRPSLAAEVQRRLTSTLRKRRTKMNKHKWRKRRKKFRKRTRQPWAK